MTSRRRQSCRVPPATWLGCSRPVLARLKLVAEQCPHVGVHPLLLRADDVIQ